MKRAIHMQGQSALGPTLDIVNRNVSEQILHLYQVTHPYPLLLVLNALPLEPPIRPCSRLRHFRA